MEEAFTGHELVKAFGRQREVEQVFDERNQKLYESSWRAQFISGVIMPVIMFLGNLNYVAVAVVGGLRVASGSLSLGEVQAFIQYSRQFSQPLTQIGSMVNLLQSGWPLPNASSTFSTPPRNPRSRAATVPSR